MIRKVIFIVLFIPFACSGPPTSDEDIIVPSAKMLTSEEMDFEKMRVVSGMVFEVEDFNTWMDTYGEVAEGLIIAFRNVDAPDVTLVFEGSPDLDAAEDRVDLLASETFLNNSTAFDDPIASYYEIKFVDTVANPPTHFFALSYANDGDPAKDWVEFVKRNMNYFKELNIEPSGIGIDPRQPDRGYLLFRQFDFVASRKLLNSPRKINKFLERLELPEHTLISYWIRISN